jgi:predicted nucleotidyltransferase
MVNRNTGEEISRIALQYADSLKDNLKVHSVYVYGSYAKGSQKQDSDIDIAVVAEGFSGDLVEDTFMLMKVRRAVDHRIEPRPFSVEEFNEHDPLAKEVMLTGIRIL